MDIKSGWCIKGSVQMSCGVQASSLLTLFAFMNRPSPSQGWDYSQSSIHELQFRFPGLAPCYLYASVASPAARRCLGPCKKSAIVTISTSWAKSTPWPLPFSAHYHRNRCGNQCAPAGCPPNIFPDRANVSVGAPKSCFVNTSRSHGFFVRQMENLCPSER